MATPTLISGFCALFRLTVSISCDARLPDPPSMATDFHCVLHFQLSSQTFFLKMLFSLFLDCEGSGSVNSLRILLTNLVNAKSKEIIHICFLFWHFEDWLLSFVDKYMGRIMCEANTG